METPSCVDGAQTTESNVVADETWRTLLSIRTRGLIAASQRRDAFKVLQVMTARYVSAEGRYVSESAL